MGLREGSWSKGILEKFLLSQEGKEPFIKRKKFAQKYSMLIILSKWPENYFPRLLERPKWQIVIFFPVPVMETFPLLVIYLFNSGELDHVLKICFMLSYLITTLTKSVKRLSKNSYVIWISKLFRIR